MDDRTLVDLLKSSLTELREMTSLTHQITEQLSKKQDQVAALSAEVDRRREEIRKELAKLQPEPRRSARLAGRR